jgi:oligopeptide/dipeptide ABC transporter ATP-binding protein
MSAPLLDIEQLSVAFTRADRTAYAVREVSLKVAAGQCLAVVGESGAGKSQLFLAALGLLAPSARIKGSVQFAGEQLLGMPRARLNRLRGSRLCMAFQDPMSALTPHLKVGEQLAEVREVHFGAGRAEALAAAESVLAGLGVGEPGLRLRQYPHQLSGGMRQRVQIAMCLLGEPKLLIADEPTTALDVAIQAQVLELLRAARLRQQMALVLISHDLAVVAGIADRVAVMYAGRVVEVAAAAHLLQAPAHPYSAALLHCVPSLTDPIGERMPTLAGYPPPPEQADGGCAFAPRCPRAQARCQERPALQAHRDGLVACHFPA